MQIQMLAVQINHSTYSLAVASLPPVFATIPFEKVDDHMLILNELTVIGGRKGRKQTLTVGNAWMNKEMFWSRFTFTDEDSDWTRHPAPIARIS